MTTSNEHNNAPSVPQDSDPTSKEQYRRMFVAACEALGAISDVLGCDPEDGGAEPILGAVEELHIGLGLSNGMLGCLSAAPAVPQEEGRPGIPLRKAYKHLLIVAPAQEVDKSVADAEIKAMYVESQGSDKGWLGIEGSYFIGGVVAARKQKAALAQALALPTADCRPFA